MKTVNRNTAVVLPTAPVTEIASASSAKDVVAVPAFLQSMMQDIRGNEEVSSTDLVIPRIELIQGLSKAKKKTDSNYIDGADEGMLYNSVTRELYGKSMVVVPVMFRKEYLVWRDLKAGGGFAGAFPDVESASVALAAQPNPSEWQIIDTNQHFVVVVNPDGSLEEAVISMAKTKSKTSRLWNSLIRINGGPRFSRAYLLEGIPAQSKAGQDYFTLQVKNIGFVKESVFRFAESIYELVKSGHATADYSDATDSDTTDGSVVTDM